MSCEHNYLGEYDPVCFKCGDYKIEIPSGSGKVMCETISKYLKEKHNIVKSPMEIWEYSPTGELAYVFQMYRNIKVEEFKNKDLEN